eukprot:1859742-Prymnesium_polylepis.1
MREEMNITDEQAESVASKVKAMRTCVGWFSSPACSLIYQCSKYVALFSSKGYAIGAKFRKWLEAEQHLKAEGRLEGEILGGVEDMMAICGSRDYVFFMDAAVTDRFAQAGSLLTFLEEEKDMAAEAGASCATRSSPALARTQSWRPFARSHSSATLCCGTSSAKTLFTGPYR